MTSLFEQVNRKALLEVAENPRWSVQEDTTGAPPSASSGVSMQNASVNRLQISLREDITTKTTRFAREYSGATAATVTFTIGNNSLPIDLSTASEENELQLIVNSLNVNSEVLGITASIVEIDGTEYVQIVGNDSDDYTVEVTDDLVGGDLFSISHEDASTTDATIYRLPAGVSMDRPGWAKVSAESGIDVDGLQISVDVAGFSRCYVKIENADGDLTVTHGPAILGAI